MMETKPGQNETTESLQQAGIEPSKAKAQPETARQFEKASSPEEQDRPEQPPCHGCSGMETAACHGAMQEEGKIDRAQFVRTALGGVAILWGGMTLYPIYSYLSPKPGDSDDAKTRVTSLEVCKVSEIPKGSGRNFRFGSTPALLIHTEDGQLHAFKAICTHLGCTVQFRDDKQEIWCACHGGTYDPATGKNIAGPPPKPLAPLKVEVVKDKVIVSQA